MLCHHKRNAVHRKYSRYFLKNVKALFPPFKKIWKYLKTYPAATAKVAYFLELFCTQNMRHLSFANISQSSFVSLLSHGMCRLPKCLIFCAYLNNDVPLCSHEHYSKEDRGLLAHIAKTHDGSKLSLTCYVRHDIKMDLF